MRVSRGYRERHSNCTIMACFVMLILVVGSAYYIWNYGLSNDDDEIVITSFDVSIGMYAPETNLTGIIRIYFDNGTLYQTLDVAEYGGVEGVAKHPAGNYKLYYEGITNEINFGPVEYTVSSQDALLVDRDFVGVRLTIRTA